MSRYRYTLLSDYTVPVPEFAGKLDRKFDTRWFSIDTDGSFTCNKGYSWDGSTGVPDGDLIDHPIPGLHVIANNINDGVRTTTRASLIHDNFYQHLERIAHLLQMSDGQVRKIGDKLFLKYCRMDGFSSGGLYYIGVRVLGGPYHALRKWWLDTP